MIKRVKPKATARNKKNSSPPIESALPSSEPQTPAPQIAQLSEPASIPPSAPQPTQIEPSLPAPQESPSEDYSHKRGVRLNYIRGVDKSATDFFLDLATRNENLRRGDTLVDILIAAGKATSYAPPLAALAIQKREKMEEAQKRLVDCPLGDDGKWLAVEEMTGLGLECSKEAIAGILKDDPQKFPSRVVGTGKPSQTKYWIDFRNLDLLEKKGRGTKGWYNAMDEFLRAKSEYEQLTASLETILKRPILSESGPVQANPVQLEGQPENGIRMTAKEIKAAGSTYNPFYLSTILNKNSVLFLTRRRSGKGRAVEALITRDNYQKAGLDHYPADPAPLANPTRDDSPEGADPTSSPTQETVPAKTFDIYGEKVTIKPSDNYPALYVRSILKKVHPAAFSDLTLSNLISKYGKDGGNIEGQQLIQILEQTNGMMVASTSSTRKRLESLLRVDEMTLNKLLANPEVQTKFLHTLPGIIDTPYILNSEVDDFRKYAAGAFLTSQVNDLRAALGNGGSFPRPPVQVPPPSTRTRLPLAPELVDTLKKYNQILRDSDIFPPGKAYDALLHLGILKQDSAEEMNRTYANFMQMMDGWEFRDLKAVSDREGFQWYDFSRRVIPNLISRGFVRNLASSAPNNGAPLYVVAKGKMEDIRAAARQYS
jgi:hypothetical protein